MGDSDEQRCRRSDGKQWRCTGMAMEGSSLCERHYFQARLRNEKTSLRKKNPEEKRTEKTRALRKKSFLARKRKLSDQINWRIEGEESKAFTEKHYLSNGNSGGESDSRGKRGAKWKIDSSEENADVLVVEKKTSASRKLEMSDSDTEGKNGNGFWNSGKRSGDREKSGRRGVSAGEDSVTARVVTCAKPERSLPSKLRKKVIPDAEEKFADFAQNSKNTALKKVSVVQRRSKRFLKRPLPRQDEETKPVTENIEISESDRDSTSSCKKKKARMGEFSAEKDEDKTDYLILLLEENKKMIEQLNFEKSCLCFATQNPSFANFNALEEKKNNFRNLYIDCHKKLDLSIRENHLLSNKLEKALGRLETFQKGFTEGIAKIEQAIFVSSLTEKSETGKSRVGYAGEDDIKHPSSGGKKAARTGKKR